MKTLLKIAAAALGLLILSAALTPWLLSRFLPPEKVRALAEQYAAKSLHRQVRLGAVSYGLVEGITLDDVAVSESPDFAAGTFVAAKRLHVRPQWLPLLHKKIELDRLAADGLSVTVVRHSASAYNYSDLLSTAPSQGGSSPLAVNVRRLSVSGADLSYRDAVTGDQWRVAPLDLKAGHLRLDGPFSLELSAKVSGQTAGKPVEASLAYSGTLDLAGQVAEFKKLSAEYVGYALQASGKVSGFSEPKLDVSYSAAFKGLTLAEGAFKGQAKTAPVEVEGELSAKVPALTAQALSTLGAGKLPPVPALDVSARFSFAGESLLLSAFHAAAKQGTVDLSGRVDAVSSGAPRPDVEFSAKADLPAFASEGAPWAKLPAGLNVPTLSVSARGHYGGDALRLAELHATAKQGTVEASGTAQGLSSAKPRLDLTVSAKLDLPEIRSSDVAFLKLPAGYVSPAMALDGKIRVSGDDLEIAALHVKAKAGTADVSGVVRRFQTQPDPNLAVAAKLNLPGLKTADLPFAAPAGLSIPATRWDLDASGSLDEAKIRHLRLIAGKNDVEIADGRVSGLRTATPLFSILVKCRSFDLAELTQLSESTREMGLSGTGLFALEVTGKWPKPILAGKMRFEGLGATVAGLKLSEFGGTATFDEKRFDIPKLSGKVEDGTLDVDLTVKNYATSPAIDLQASLDRFDLGKFLTAKAKLAQAPAQAQATSGKPTPLDARGKLDVGVLSHPSAEAHGLRVNWDVTNLTPDLRGLSGTADFKTTGGGRFNDLGKMATQSKLVKVLVFPLMVFQKIGKLGGIRLFPDFNNVTFTDLAGDYAFDNGVMTLKDSHVVSDAGTVSAKGTIGLPDSTLDLVVTAQVAALKAIDVDVKGSFDNPKTHMELAKFLFQKEEAVETAAPLPPSGQPSQP